MQEKVEETARRISVVIFCPRVSVLPPDSTPGNVRQFQDEESAAEVVVDGGHDACDAVEVALRLVFVDADVDADAAVGADVGADVDVEDYASVLGL